MKNIKYSKIIMLFGCYFLQHTTFVNASNYWKDGVSHTVKNNYEICIENGGGEDECDYKTNNQVTGASLGYTKTDYEVCVDHGGGEDECDAKHNNQVTGKPLDQGYKKTAYDLCIEHGGGEDGCDAKHNGIVKGSSSTYWVNGVPYNKKSDYQVCIENGGGEDGCDAKYNGGSTKKSTPNKTKYEICIEHGGGEACGTSSKNKVRDYKDCLANGGTEQGCNIKIKEKDQAVKQKNNHETCIENGGGAACDTRLKKDIIYSNYCRALGIVDSEKCNQLRKCALTIGNGICILEQE